MDETGKMKDVTIGTDKVETVDRFCYLGDMIDGKGDRSSSNHEKQFMDPSGVLCRK